MWLSVRAGLRVRGCTVSCSFPAEVVYYDSQTDVAKSHYKIDFVLHKCRAWFKKPYRMSKSKYGGN